jgi:acyl-CoA reductase-like NAD-dependent aldehyde dehydrogenase
MYNHVASALFAGNAVVIKISEYSAWSGAKYIELGRAVLAAAGHDPDLLQLVHGFGETGAALVSAVDKLIFTGSPGVGKLVMKGASSVSRRAGVAVMPARPLQAAATGGVLPA